VSIEFRGVFAEALGGFLTVRGYAKLSDLVQCSAADTAYQRELKPLHEAELKAFYQRGEYLFYPEVVLSLELAVDYEVAGAPTEEPWQLVRSGNPFKSNVNGVDVKRTKTKTASDLIRVNIAIPEGAGKVLKRIDGNHRLSAFESLADPEFDRYVAPFCIVIFASNNARQNEKALFYNINSKALPLSSEEVYKGIVDDETGFPDDVLARDFGPEFVLCRQTRKELNFTYLQNVLGVFGQDPATRAEAMDSRCSVLIESLRDLQRERTRLENPSPLPECNELVQTIQTVNASYADTRLKSSTSLGLFSAFLFFATHDGARYRQFEAWVLKNHQYELQIINASDLIRIFEKVAISLKRQIFVSMQFTADTKPNYDAIKHAVDDVNNVHGLDIKLREIRLDHFDTGYSYPINQQILQLIEESGLLIADLSCGNKNVYHEVGYLMGLNRGNGLPHENFILIHNSEIGDIEKDIGFNVIDLKQLRKGDTNALREELKKQLIIYYRLVG
jgi:hypothetical protein